MAEIKTVPTRHGNMQIYDDDYYIGRSLDLYGEYSPDEAALFAKLVRPGFTVLDVGANLGALSLPLAELVGKDGRVYAYEPQPENFTLLRENCAGRDNIVIESVALGDEDGHTRVTTIEQFSSGKNYGGAIVGKGDRIVELRKLDSFAWNRVDFIKIDVEGAEENVLTGAAETIARFRPILYVEDHPERGPHNSLLRMIWKLGYKIWAHVPPLFSPQNFNDSTTNVFPNIVNYNVLCLPKEIARRVREQCSPRHVPDQVFEIAEVPRTLSGKVLEVPVKRILMGTPVEKAASRDSLANPASLDYFVEMAKTL